LALLVGETKRSISRKNVGLLSRISRKIQSRYAENFRKNPKGPKSTGKGKLFS
jgi:hypothetical protein